MVYIRLQYEIDVGIYVINFFHGRTLKKKIELSFASSNIVS